MVLKRLPSCYNIIYSEFRHIGKTLGRFKRMIGGWYLALFQHEENTFLRRTLTVLRVYKMRKT